MKNKVDKLDVDKLELVSVDLKKLTIAAEKVVVEKTVSNELVKKVNAIDAGGFVKQTDHDNKVSGIKGKINLFLV